MFFFKLFLVLAKRIGIFICGDLSVLFFNNLDLRLTHFQLGVRLPECYKTMLWRDPVVNFATLSLLRKSSVLAVDCWTFHVPKAPKGVRARIRSFLIFPPRGPKKCQERGGKHVTMPRLLESRPRTFMNSRWAHHITVIQLPIYYQKR
jgi:hypothetical protein